MKNYLKLYLKVLISSLIFVHEVTLYQDGELWNIFFAIEKLSYALFEGLTLTLCDKVDCDLSSL